MVLSSKMQYEFRYIIIVRKILQLRTEHLTRFIRRRSSLFEDYDMIKLTKIGI